VTRHVAGRPVGLSLIVAWLVVNGVAALIAAFDLGNLSSRGRLSAALIGRDLPVVAAGVAVFVALLFFSRAYMLWTFHRVAWWSTLIRGCFSGLSAILEITVAPSELPSWTHLVVSVITIVILLRPNVRALFA